MSAIFSIYLWLIGGIYFFILMLFFFLCSYFISPKTYDPWIKKLLRILFKIMFIKVEVQGNEKIDPAITYLYMANHSSLFDVPLLGGFVPGLVRGLEADRQFRWPLYGNMVKRAGNIPIAREDIHSSIKSIRQLAKRLRNGNSMIIMPEGHRTITGNIGKFMKLPFFLAKQAEKDIVPIGLSGLYDLKRKGSWIISPRPIKITFGDIIPAEKIKEMSTLELRDHTKMEIEKLIETK